MNAKYRVTEMSGGWAVVMSASRRIMETFPTEAEASQVLALYEGSKRVNERRPQVWIVDGFVCEADISGTQLGEVGEIDLKQYDVVSELSREQYDEQVEQLYKENGHYPDE